MTNHAPFTLVLKRKLKRKGQIIAASSLKSDLEDEKGRSYTSYYWCIADSFKGLQHAMEKMELDLTAEMLQKPCLLGTAKILQKVLDEN